MKNRFYRACRREDLGGLIAWHAKEGRGYTTDVSKAHEYTLLEAQNSWEIGRGIDQPISADHVDALTVFRVDMQVIPNSSELGSQGTAYAAFKKGKYNGNDVFWYTGDQFDNDFSMAKILTENEAVNLAHVVYLPFILVSEKSRPVFEIKHFNARVMVQGAGIKIPHHVKLERNRKGSSGKVRWNCPGCGKINWQYNPYDFDGCSDVLCSEHSYGYLQ